MKKTVRLIALAMVTVMLCLALASCGGPNADPDKALAALKENGVTFATKQDGLVAKIVLEVMGVDSDKVDCVVSGTGKLEDKYAHITIIYFDEAADANDEWEDIQEYVEEDAKKDEEAKESEWVCKKSGKMIYFGTKNAVDAAK